MSTEESRHRAAELVAGVILARWRAAGIEAWRRSAAGVPEPAGAHGVEIVVGRTSPSGCTLFRCPTCGTESKVPPRGLCSVGPVRAAYFPIVRALIEGARYQPDAAGVPRPIEGGSRG